MLTKKTGVTQAIRSGWHLTTASWSVWLLLVLVSLLFTWFNQQVILPGLSKLLPLIPPAALERVPVESYITLAMEGGHELFASPFLRQILLALGIIALLQLLLQPFLQVLVFSQLRQPQPTVSFLLLWQQLSHRLPAFFVVILLQFFVGGLLMGGLGWLLWVFASQLLMYGKSEMLATIPLLLLLAALFFSWGFSFFTFWQVSLAEGDKLYQGATRAFGHTVRWTWGKSLLLPLAFWLLTTAVVAFLQTAILPLPSSFRTMLAASLQHFFILWLTYSLAFSLSPAARK